jgi:hypothetical protein
MSRHDIRNVCPEFEDINEQPKILEQLRHYALHMGMSPNEIDKVKDRRHLNLIYKAQKLDELYNAIKSGKIKLVSNDE